MNDGNFEAQVNQRFTKAAEAFRRFEQQLAQQQQVHDKAMAGLLEQMVKLHAAQDKTGQLAVEMVERVDDVCQQLADLPDTLFLARSDEAIARQSLSDAKEAMEMAVSIALSTANGQVDGKNESERKVKRDAYLAKQPEVSKARADVVQAEIKATNASLTVRAHEERFAAMRSLASLLAARLNYK